MAKPLTKQFTSLQFVVHATVQEHSVDFVAYDIEGFFGARLDAPAINESEPYLHGTVKWDGCSNWYFDEQDRVMLHGCQRSDLTRFGEVMAACWDWASELLEPTWQGS
jgi:hypothetical protein